MLSFTWDSAYESRPTSVLARSSIDDEIRKIKRGVRERMEREHHWGPFTEKNDGSHKGGGTTIALRDTALVRSSLTNVEKGAIFFEEDGDNILTSYYDGSSWVSELTSFDHNTLSGLDIGDPHPQYAISDMVLSNALDANNNNVKINDTLGSNVLTWGHRSTLDVHSPIDAPSAFMDRALGLSRLKSSVVTMSTKFKYKNGDILGEKSRVERKDLYFTYPERPHFVISLRAWVSDFDDPTDSRSISWALDGCALEACMGSNWGFGVTAEYNVPKALWVIVTSFGITEITFEAKFLRIDP